MLCWMHPRTRVPLGSRDTVGSCSACHQPESPDPSAELLSSISCPSLTMLRNRLPVVWASRSTGQMLPPEPSPLGRVAAGGDLRGPGFPHLQCGVLDSASRLDEEHKLIARYAARLAAETSSSLVQRKLLEAMNGRMVRTESCLLSHLPCFYQQWSRTGMSTTWVLFLWCGRAWYCVFCSSRVSREGRQTSPSPLMQTSNRGS
ncbi:uncharacterized protein [Patagioenas fasciata]|uniref:uncharacterized protein isoform X14 n=1 Tax=Patagioenas fasciata TaxID=372321 RepID=UPI003A9A2AEA